MKKYLFALFFVAILGCTSNDDGNSILPNVPVNFSINMNLNQYNDLLTVDSSTAFVENQGIRGIIIFRFSSSRYIAWDAACPHILPNNCSTMFINGVIMVCPCDNTEFNILDGSPLSGTEFSARQYRVTRNGNILTITSF